MSVWKISRTIYGHRWDWNGYAIVYNFGWELSSETGVIGIYPLLIIAKWVGMFDSFMKDN